MRIFSNIEKKIFIRENKALNNILIIDIFISAFICALIKGIRGSNKYNSDIALKINLNNNIEQLKFFFIIVSVFIIIIFLYRLFNKHRIKNYKILNSLGLPYSFIISTIIIESVVLFLIWLVSSFCFQSFLFHLFFS